MRRSHLPLAVGCAAALLGSWLHSPVEAQQPSRVADGAHRGYLAVRAASSGEYEVIDERNADGLFVPASALKLVTVGATLEHLGPDYRWLTRLTSEAVVTRGVLDGDLIVEPGADPTWDGDAAVGSAPGPLAALARQIRDHGVTRITGDLIVDTGRFPGRAHPVDRPYGDLPYRPGTPAAGLAIDEATITVRVAPGAAVGDRARVLAPDDVEVLNRTTTVGRDRHGAGTLDFVPVWGTDTLLLRGEYPISEGAFVVSASDPAPALRAARRLREALVEAGVSVEGVARVRDAGAGVGDRVTLAEHRSPPLQDLLPQILTESHNWYADMLVLTLSREVAGSGRFDDGVEVVSDFASARLEEDEARAQPGVWIRDGSGLASSNLITPATVVRVLAHVLEQPWASIMIDAMARRGEGTLRAWPGLPPIAAKTGTLRHTVALAGLLDPGSGAPVIFCYFVNHHPERPGAARREIASAVARWLGRD